jgi:aspartate/methionine/tyrosine aminotransferase
VETTSRDRSSVKTLTRCRRRRRRRRDRRRGSTPPEAASSPGQPAPRALVAAGHRTAVAERSVKTLTRLRSTRAMLVRSAPRVARCVGRKRCLAGIASVSPSNRSDIRSFKVMDVVAAANALEEEGRWIARLEIGQPQSAAPQAAIKLAQEQLGADRCGYTAARGEVPLRDAIAKMYERDYDGSTVTADRIHLTPGSSGAFMLAFMSAFDAGDAVALPSSSYPCYRNILQALDCELVALPIDPATYNVTAADLAKAQDERSAAGLAPIKGLILSSPANPTGAMLTPDDLRDICAYCDETGVQFISDELYHGITYPSAGAPRAASASEFSEEAIVINGFSKYYSMTGWRLGWLVAPKRLDEAINKLNQNLNISAPTISQRAGIAALTEDAAIELKEHVARYEANRQVVIDGLAAMGITDVAPSQGAFYVYANLEEHGITDSLGMSQSLLREVGVAVTPGIDFEDPASGLGEKRVRISYPGATDDVRKGMGLLKQWWESPSGLAARGK